MSVIIKHTFEIQKFRDTISNSKRIILYSVSKEEMRTKRTQEKKTMEEKRKMGKLFA